MKIILASASPRRREICELIGVDFEVIPSKNEEAVDLSLPPEQAIEKIAYSKGLEVFLEHNNQTVLSSDTAVYLGGEFFEKPKDKDDARQMLKKLSGKTHKVITAVSIFSPKKQITFSDVALVTFDRITDSEIEDYLAENEWCDKAGAYGIQGKAARFIKNLNGDFYTVMGLPCSKTYQVLKNFDK